MTARRGHASAPAAARWPPRRDQALAAGHLFSFLPGVPGSLPRAREPIMGKLKAIFMIPELRQKILLTLLFLAIYRIGYSIPLPYINQKELARQMGGGGPLGQI